MKLCHAVNSFWRILIIYLCIIQVTGGAFLRCYNGSLDDYLVTPLDAKLPPLFLSCLDSNLPSMIYTFGYRGRVAGPATTAVLSAYIATRKRNVILLDWEEEAKSGLLGIPLGYAFSAFPKSKKIGKEMGMRLIDIAQAGYNMTNIHLIGHSLGAHIMGFAGQRSREQGHVIPRITGLDPARALFEGTFAVHRGLDRTCAKFVDIIHTDPGGYGTSTSTGTVDIWPNYRPGGYQPGCDSGDYPMFSSEDKTNIDYMDYSFTEAKKIKYIRDVLRYAMRRPNLCKHDRSWQYYVEAVASPTAFLAAAAPNYDSWVENHDDAQVTIYLGDLTSTRAKGNFYLSTNSKSPFGRGPEGLKPNEDQTDSQSLSRVFNYFR